MHRFSTKRLSHIAVFGAIAAATVLLMPGSPSNWDDVFEEMSARRNAKILNATGAKKHVPGLEYFYMSRTYGNFGINVDLARQEAMRDVDFRENKSLRKATMANTWTALGPANTGGRIRAIAFRPGDYSTLYAGGASGGVFKSTEGGMSASWEPIMDFADAIPVGAIAIDPQNPDVIYVGTGEPTMDLVKSYGAPSYAGVGVMKSTDGGTTWNRMPWPDNSSAIHTVIVHPTNSNIVLVASRSNLYRSEDGGQNWARVQSGIITDVAFREDNPDIIYAAIGNDNGTSINGVYVSTTGGVKWSWSKVADNWPDPDSTGRIELATTPADPNLLLAFVMRSRTTQNGDNDFLAVMRSTNNGTNWERLHGNLPSDFTSGQGFYNLCAAISPTNKDLILAGGFEVYQSQNSGTTWSRVTRGNSPVHVDQHVLEFTEDGKYVYLGNDGGVYRSATNGSSWTPLNDQLETIQFYTLAFDPNDDERFYGGAQDHGVFQTFDLGKKSWRLRRGGDGGYILVDPDNSNILYSRVAVEGGTIPVPSRSTNSGQSWSRLDRGFGSIEQDRFNWLTPMMLSPADRTRMYTATQFMYTAKGVDQGSPSWSTVGDVDLTKRSSYQYGVVSSFDICESDASFMWIGCGDGRVQYSDVITSLDVEWFDATDGLPNRWVSEVRVDRSNPDIAIVVFSGYGTGHVFKTTDRGATWVDISGNLPDVPVNGIVFSRQKPASAYFAATDIGVWFTEDNGQTWARFGDGLPNVVVYDIDIDEQNRLIAATHGRGMWITSAVLSADAPEATAGNFALQQNYPNPLTSGGTTTISFTLQNSDDVTLKLYDASGKLVRTLVDNNQNPGSHNVNVNTSGLLSGVYFYTLSSGSQSVTRKLVVL